MPPANKDSREKRSKDRDKRKKTASKGKAKKKSKSDSSAATATAAAAAAPNKKKLPTQEEKKKPETSSDDESLKDTKDSSKRTTRPRPANFKAEEDIHLCRAHVNVSTDAATGTDQSMDKFWERIKLVFDEMCAKDKECEDCPKRSATSLRTRFNKIRKEVNLFNGYYKRVKDKNPSGYTAENITEEALENFNTGEGKPFGWVKCAEVLWELPKFQPMLVDLSEDPDDEDNKTNRVKEVMGQGMARPLGAKTTKAGMKKSDAATLATLESEKVSSMTRMMGASEALAKTMSYQSTIGGYTDQAKLFLAANDMDKFAEAMRMVTYWTDIQGKELQAKNEAEALKEADTCAPSMIEFGGKASAEETEITNDKDEEEVEAEEEKEEEDHLAKYVAVAGKRSKSVCSVEDSDESNEEEKEKEESIPNVAV